MRKTMTVDPRGGFRPTAPQNNPANISATGGDGQSGRATQPARYMPGLGYGKGKEQMEQQTAATMAGNPVAASAQSAATPPTLPPAVGMFEPTQRPEEPITAGMDFGPGPDSSILGIPNVPKEPDPAIAAIQTLYLQNPRNEDLRLIVQTLQDEGRL